MNSSPDSKVTLVQDSLVTRRICRHKEMLSIESGLITCGNRIIVPKEMRPEMLQYVHEGHQTRRDVSLWQGTLYFGPS